MRENKYTQNKNLDSPIKVGGIEMNPANMYGTTSPKELKNALN